MVPSIFSCSSATAFVVLQLQLWLLFYKFLQKTKKYFLKINMWYIPSIISASDTVVIFLLNSSISSTSTYFVFLIFFLIQFIHDAINVVKNVVTNDIATDPTTLIIVDIISLLLFDPHIQSKYLKNKNIIILLLYIIGMCIYAYIKFLTALSKFLLIKLCHACIYIYISYHIILIYVYTSLHSVYLHSITAGTTTSGGTITLVPSSCSTKWKYIIWSCITM